MKRFFIADTHFGCSNKLIRGMLRLDPVLGTLFESTEAHDQCLLNAINGVVKPNDELYVIGDFSKYPGRYRSRIKCKHVSLIMGNHDPVQKSRNVFGPNIPFQREVRLRGRTGYLHCILAHSPQAFWFGSHKGWAHLYGHVHGQREDTLDLLGKGRRSFDVGVDNLRNKFGNYFPLDEEQLYDMLSSRKGHDHGSYYYALQAERDRKHGFEPQRSDW